MYTMKARLLMSLFLITIIMAACGPAADTDPADVDAGQDGVSPEPVVGLANPAAVYCQGLGYQMEARQPVLVVDGRVVESVGWAVANTPLA